MDETLSSSVDANVSGEAGEAEADDPRIGRDEVPFLNSRKESSRFSGEKARDRANQLARRALHADGTEGAEQHEQGELLNELYMHHADQALESPSWRAFLEAHWPLSVRSALRRMRIGRVFTASEVIEWKLSKCDLALRLIDALGLVDAAAKQFPEDAKKAGSLSRHALEILLATELPLPEKAGGGTITFPAPVRELEGALREIRRATREPDTNESAGRRLIRHRAVIAEMAAEDPEIAAIKPKAFLEDGQVVYSLRAKGRAGVAAGQRLLERLDRLR